MFCWPSPPRVRPTWVNAPPSSRFTCVEAVRGPLRDAPSSSSRTPTCAACDDPADRTDTAGTTRDDMKLKVTVNGSVYDVDVDVVDRPVHGHFQFHVIPRRACSVGPVCGVIACRAGRRATAGRRCVPERPTHCLDAGEPA